MNRCGRSKRFILLKKIISLFRSFFFRRHANLNKNDGSFSDLHSSEPERLYQKC